MSSTGSGTNLESLDQGIAYEALRDALNSEIARHLDVARANPSSADAGLHDAAADNLIEARQKLTPDNTEAIEVASLIVRSYRDTAAQRAR